MPAPDQRRIGCSQETPGLRVHDLKACQRDELYSGALVRIGADESVIKDAFWLVSRRRVRQSSAVNTFSNRLRQTAAQATL